MKPMPVSKPTKKALWLRGPFLLAVVPLTLFVVCLIAWGIYERRAAQRIRAELVRVRDAGYPIGNASLSQWFRDHTSAAETHEWHQLLGLAGAAPVDHERLPYVGTAPIPASVAPDAPWPEEAEVAEYLDAMRPVIQRIHQAAERASDEEATPVWQPILFQGFNTPLEELQGSRQLVRLLQLETEYALHQRDAERALRALDSMQHVAEVFDWPIFLVCDLVQIALRGVHQGMVRRSLAADLWNEDQLRQLADQLGPPRNIAQRWRDVIGGERAIMVASIGEPEAVDPGGPPAMIQQWLFALPSVREQLLDAYRQIEALAVDQPGELAQRSDRLTRQWQAEGQPQSVVLLPSQAYQLLLPGVHGYAAAIEREETSRRFAVTAVAIKQFQLQQGRWPQQLADLREVGLTADTWQTVSGGPFGYEVAEEGAYLWSYEPTKEKHVSTTRPTAEELEDSYDRLMTLIR